VQHPQNSGLTDENHKGTSGLGTVHEAKIHRNQLGYLFEMSLEATQQARKDNYITRQHASGGALRGQQREQRYHDHGNTQREVDDSCVENHSWNGGN
jgi:hypothetical protein